MANSSSLSPSLAIFLFVGVLLAVSSPAGAGSQGLGLGWVAPSSEKCRGSIAECGGAGEEFSLDSEISRRVLATTQYISYGALQSNTVPCSQRGASYYNCQQGAQANPYSRGCSQLAKCRS